MSYDIRKTPQATITFNNPNQDLQSNHQPSTLSIIPRCLNSSMGDIARIDGVKGEKGLTSIMSLLPLLLGIDHLITTQHELLLLA
jgi:hypothetical protein